MLIKRLARRLAERFGYEVYNKRLPHVYSEDGFSTIHDHRFVDDQRFTAAYARGIEANGGHDHRMRWRAHVVLWTAMQSARFPGDFVECGVSRGFLASAIMKRLDWNTLSKRYFLFDTWRGLDPRYVTGAEAARLDWYKSDSFEAVRANFSEFERTTLIRGPVPDTLGSADIGKVAFLSLDMNCAAPEIAAAEFFWDKLVPGAFIVLDDYAYYGFSDQYAAFNDFARRTGVEILSLPTGQGLMCKPHA